MFFSIRVSNQIRKAMSASGLADQARSDYNMFVGQLLRSPAKAREDEVIKLADASGMSVAQAAYEVLSFEYKVAARLAASPDAVSLAEHPRMFDNAMLAIAISAALLAQGVNIPADRLLLDFPLLNAGNHMA